MVGGGLSVVIGRGRSSVVGWGVREVAECLVKLLFTRYLSFGVGFVADSCCR